MIKIFLILVFLISFEQLGVPREIDIRRFNQNVLQQNTVYDSTVGMQILKNLSAWDKLQAQQNISRLFIRGVIIQQ